MRIGIDFDNTLVGYDSVFLSAARERKLVHADFAGKKQALRDALRLLPDGELAWQRLQGYVYGKGMAGAVLLDGVDAFLRRCRSEGCSIFIVSHKTEYGHYDPERVNLRQAAMAFMEARGFFSSDGYGISRENVYFETTRGEKIARIAALRCTCFIDDLEEVLTDPAFPPGVTRLLFANHGPGKDITVCSSWQHVAQAVFDERSAA